MIPTMCPGHEKTRKKEKAKEKGRTKEKRKAAHRSHGKKNWLTRTGRRQAKKKSFRQKKNFAPRKTPPENP